MEFKILKYVLESNARNWLRANVGVAVIETTASIYKEDPDIHLQFSNLMSEGDMLLILEHFPDAINCNKFEELEFDTFLVRSYSRRDGIEILKSLGGVVVKSVCAYDELPDTQEMTERLEYLQLRFDRPLSEVDPAELKEVYLKIYHSETED